LKKLFQACGNKPDEYKQFKRRPDMARSLSKLLDTDDLFPPLDLQITREDTLTLPGDPGDDYSVFLIYRGDW
jgi:hypothetical protein